MKPRNPLSRSCREGGSGEPPTLTSLSSWISSEKQTETTVNSKPEKGGKKETSILHFHIHPPASIPASVPHSSPSNIQITTRMVARLKANNAVLNVKFASNFFFLCMRKSTLILSMCLSNSQPVDCQVRFISLATWGMRVSSKLPRVPLFIW